MSRYFQGRLNRVNCRAWDSEINTMTEQQAKQLQDKTLLITGAAGALGSALARLCATQGAQVVLLDKNRTGLETLCDEIAEQPDCEEPILMPLDLAGAGPEDYQQVASALEESLGGLDGLIHCAAHFTGLQPSEQIDPKDWWQTQQSNVNGPWLLTAACLHLLSQAPAGKLYFLLDDLVQVKRAYWGSYGVSKHALAGLVQQLADELENTPIEVLGINPGPMRSALRSAVYMAENPNDQPDPAIAAGKIVELLTADNPVQQPLIDF